MTDTDDVQSGQTADTFSNPAIRCPPNIESTNPEWVNVGTSSVGTETTPPVGSKL
jgi:hypothetical protein